MYLEMLHEVVNEILSDDRSKGKIIEIELTSFVYDTLQLELNDYIGYKIEVPIESLHATSVNMYSRTINLKKGSSLNPIFERIIVARLAELESLKNQYRNRDGH